jgi:hypothetical protein
MRPLRLLLVICLALWQCVFALFGDEFHLNNGDILRGKAVSFNDDGLVVHLDIGEYSPRISWSKLTQDTLKELMKEPQAAKFVEPFIDVPPVPKDKDNKKKNIVVKPVPRVERVQKASFFSFWPTPAGLVVALVLILANVYAAYQIALYRHRPPGLVCGLAVVLPVIVPAIVLAMPPAAGGEYAEAPPEPAAAASAAGKTTTGPLAKVPMASGLSVAQAEKPAAAGGASASNQVFKRGEFTFNRRFMETKFPNFFRIVQNEAEKDLVLAIRTPKAEHIGKRISRISSNEMHVQLVRGGEVMVPFSDITEVQVRREAKA